MKLKVLVVGQTPPPLNGQTVMIQEFVEGEYKGLQLDLVRMNFSSAIHEVGTFRARKLVVLVSLLIQIAVRRVSTGASVLYYPPAGPTLVPVLRDLFLLILTRWMFRYTVFHFHAAGLPEIYPRLPAILRPLYHLAYSRPDLAIFTTASTSATGASVRAKSIAVVPLGVADAAEGACFSRAVDPSVPRILFMGICSESKGLLNLIEAAALLRNQGFRFAIICAGAFVSDTFREEVGTLLTARALTDHFHFAGVLQGEEKSNAFRQADIFCLPSHHYAESFGVVLIEAMSFGLPLVTTRWRGIPEVVEAAMGSCLVETKRPDLVAEALASLLGDPQLRAVMGKRNREWFCGHYTLDKYRARMEEALLTLT
ncbi:MAG: glycosyltransferase family 4 protein [Acidobacteria bacterium]|nr:glycosyltransferase family 4 protein [Acidobacteriota bacterium]